MTTQMQDLVSWFFYGIWNVSNIAVLFAIRLIVPSYAVDIRLEEIHWWTVEIVSVLTGISVILAITLTIKKLFWDKKERKFSKKTLK